MKATLLVPALLLAGCGPSYKVAMPMIGQAQMKAEITTFYQWLQANGRLLDPYRPEAVPKELDPKTLKPVPTKPEPPMLDTETLRRRFELQLVDPTSNRGGSERG